MGKPDVLQFMISQRVSHDLVTEQQTVWKLLIAQEKNFWEMGTQLCVYFEGIPHTRIPASFV